MKAVTLEVQVAKLLQVRSECVDALDAAPHLVVSEGEHLQVHELYEGGRNRAPPPQGRFEDDDAGAAPQYRNR